MKRKKGLNDEVVSVTSFTNISTRIRDQYSSNCFKDKANEREKDATASSFNPCHRVMDHIV